MGISPNVEKIDAESGKRSVDLEAIRKTLLSAKVSKFSKVSNTPPDVCVETPLSHNFSNLVSGTTETQPVMLSTQDMEVLEMFDEMFGYFSTLSMKGLSCIFGMNPLTIRNN